MLTILCLLMFDYNSFTHVLVGMRASNLDSNIESEDIFKFTGSHVHLGNDEK